MSKRIRKDINWKFSNELEAVMKEKSVKLRHDLFRNGTIPNKSVDDIFERFVRDLAWSTYQGILDRAKRTGE